MATFRKAIGAGMSAALAVLFTGLATEIPRTQPGWVLLGGAAVGAGFTAGLAVYNLRNDAAVPVRPAYRQQ